MSDTTPAAMTNTEAADLDAYIKKFDRLQELLKSAGGMLTQAIEYESVAGDGRASRKVADDIAREAAELRFEMRQWRLERGYTD